MGDENDSDRLAEARKPPPLALIVSFYDEEAGHKRETKVKVDPEDIIAVGGVLNRESPKRQSFFFLV